VVTSFTFLLNRMGVGNMHSALDDKLEEVKCKKLNGWDFNEKQLAFIEAVLKDDLTHQITHLLNLNKIVAETSSKQ